METNHQYPGPIQILIGYFVSVPQDNNCNNILSTLIMAISVIEPSGSQVMMTPFCREEIINDDCFPEERVKVDRFRPGRNLMCEMRNDCFLSVNLTVLHLDFDTFDAISKNESEVTLIFFFSFLI